MLVFILRERTVILDSGCGTGTCSPLKSNNDHSKVVLLVMRMLSWLQPYTIVMASWRDCTVRGLRRLQLNVYFVLYATIALYQLRIVQKTTKETDQHLRLIPARSSSSRISNMTWTPTNSTAQHEIIYATPAYEPVKLTSRSFNPSNPSAKPTRFAMIIMKTLPTQPIPVRTRYAVG